MKLNSPYEDQLKEEINIAAKEAGVTEDEAKEVIRIYFKSIKFWADDFRLPEVEIPYFGKIVTHKKDIDKIIRKAYAINKVVKDNCWEDKKKVSKAELMLKDTISWLWSIRRRRYLEESKRKEAFGKKEKTIESQENQYRKWNKIKPLNLRNNKYREELINGR